MVVNKVDLHSHFLPLAYMEYLKKYEDARPDSFDTPAWSADARIRQMDALGVAYSFISISSPNLATADDEAERDYARRINEEGARFAAKYPNRIGLMAELPLPNVRNALEEARYVLDVLGAAGFGLKTHYRDKYLGCQELDPVLEFLNNRKALVVVHPTKPYGHYEGVNEGMPIPAFEFFVETTRTFVNMVWHDTFARYPEIRWVFPHAGAFVSLLSDHFDSFAVSMKIKNPRFHADYFGAMRHVWFDLAGFPLPKQIQILKQNVPVERMLYGSDGPYTPDIVTVALAGALERTELFSDQEKERIFTNNAIALVPQLEKIFESDIQTKTRVVQMFLHKNFFRRILSSVYNMVQKRNYRRYK